MWLVQKKPSVYWHGSNAWTSILSGLPRLITCGIVFGTILKRMKRNIENKYMKILIVLQSLKVTLCSRWLGKRTSTTCIQYNHRWHGLDVFLNRIQSLDNLNRRMPCNICHSWYKGPWREKNKPKIITKSMKLNRSWKGTSG